MNLQDVQQKVWERSTYKIRTSLIHTLDDVSWRRGTTNVWWNTLCRNVDIAATMYLIESIHNNVWDKIYTHMKHTISKKQ